MAMRNRNRVIVLVLAIAAVAGLWRATSVERANQRLEHAYQEAQTLIEQLNQERTKLSEDLTGKQRTIDGQTTNLAQLEGELQRVQRELENTVQELAALEQDHEELRAEHVTTASQLSTIRQEKQQLEAKLADIRQLKLAIRDVRRQVWQRRFASFRTHWQARAETVTREDQEQLASGNRGFVLREGMTTIGKTPRLHVHVLEPRAE